jgi:signal transduction histidine kinase
MMFSLYNIIMAILFVYFALFLNSFFLFFEDLFLIIAFLSFLTIIFYTTSAMFNTYFAERANYIKSLYLKLFLRRKEAIVKNMSLLDALYVKEKNDFIYQYAALFYLKTIYIIKLYKTQEILLNNTAAQQLFIEIQKDITRELKAKNIVVT